MSSLHRDISWFHRAISSLRRAMSSAWSGYDVLTSLGCLRSYTGWCIYAFIRLIYWNTVEFNKYMHTYRKTVFHRCHVFKLGPKPQGLTVGHDSKEMLRASSYNQQWQNLFGHLKKPFIPFKTTHIYHWTKCWTILVHDQFIAVCCNQ